MIDFIVNKDTSAKIRTVVQTAVDRGLISKKDTMNHVMNLSACIAQGCDIDLDKLAAFDNFNLGHDLFGIDRHIDKEDGSPTGGKLLNCFLPRSARRVS